MSVILAAAAPEAVYIGCDAEEPNGHLVLRPVAHSEEPVSVRVPEPIAGLCTG
ncbi:MAG: ATPase, partial [Clostridiales bacterium]|nr:ATPase [Clostridiales bacterium]